MRRSNEVSSDLSPASTSPAEFFSTALVLALLMCGLPNNHPAAQPPPAGTQLPSRAGCFLSRQMIARSGSHSDNSDTHPHRLYTGPRYSQHPGYNTQHPGSLLVVRHRVVTYCIINARSPPVRILSASAYCTPRRAPPGSRRTADRCAARHSLPASE